MSPRLELFWCVALTDEPAPHDLPASSEVLSALGRAARLHPHEPDYRLQLGATLVAQGRASEGVTWLLEAASLSPADSTIQVALGRGLLAAGRPDEALAALHEASRLGPDDPEAGNALGIGLLEAGHPKAAVVSFERLLATHAGLAPVASNLAAAHVALGHAGPALEAMRRAVRLAPESARLRRNLALALQDSGERAAAVTALRHAVRLAPREAGRHLDLGDALFIQGLQQDAAAEYETALGLDASCLAGREETQRNRSALVAAEIREELKLPRPAPLDWALGQLARAGLRLAHFGRRRKGLDLALTLVLGAAVVFASLALLRPWVRHHLFLDEVVRIARLPTEDEAAVRDQLQHALRKYGLEPWLDDTACDVRVDGSMRRISCDYAVSVQLLPGLHRPVEFQLVVEEPFLAPRAHESY